MSALSDIRSDSPLPLIIFQALFRSLLERSAMNSSCLRHNWVRVSSCAGVIDQAWMFRGISIGEERFLSCLTVSVFSLSLSFHLLGLAAYGCHSPLTAASEMKRESHRQAKRYLSVNRRYLSITKASLPASAVHSVSGLRTTDAFELFCQLMRTSRRNWWGDNEELE